MSKKALLITRVSGFVPQFEMNNVRILQEMGYEVHYAANYNTVVYGEDNTRLADTGIRRHSIHFCRSPFSFAVWRSYKELVQLMLEEKFDLVHCHMPITGVLARKAAEKVRRMTGRRAKVIYTAHGFHFFDGAPPGNWLYYFPERHYARYTDKLILINQEDYERGSHFPVRGSVEFVPGVGMKPMPEPKPGFNLRDQYGIPQDHRIVISVGELTEAKNQTALVHAMDRFRREKLTCLICGAGAMKESLDQEIKEMYLQDKVILAGYCNNIPDMLRQSDYFAFPSQREGLSVALMEAMQAGLPVMAADIRGNHDLIQDGEGGFLFTENLPEDYAGALAYFMKYPDEAERMGRWNQKQVENFSLDVVEKRMREIYADEQGEC